MLLRSGALLEAKPGRAQYLALPGIVLSGFRGMRISMLCLPGNFF